MEKPDGDIPVILIVDDDEDARHLLNRLMLRCGCRTLEASNGYDALALADKHWQEIDTVVLDIMMPGDLDGYEVCDRLRQDPRTHSIPVIVLSARTSAQDMARSYASGAFQHIAKPYDIGHLEAVVASMVRLRRLERQVSTSAEKYRAIVDHSPLEMIVLGPDLRIQEMNASFRKHFPAARLGDNLLEVVYQGCEVDASSNPARDAFRTGANQSQTVQASRNGTVFYRNVHAAPLRDSDGNIVSVVELVEDVTAQKQLEERLKRQVDRHNRALQEQEKLAENLMATQRQLRQNNAELEEANRRLEEARSELERLSITDPLTGLFNRRRFGEVFDAEVRRSNRYAHPLSVLMLDIDHFKQVNDTYGHDAGDEVLRALSGLLQHLLRETDTVARYGGEEFVAVLPETDAATALRIAERLRHAVEEHAAAWRDQTLRITVSLGVASDCSKDTQADVLLRRADQALYRAKNDGRNRVAIAP